MPRAPAKAGDPVKALFEAMAWDVGKELVAYIEVMYPAALKATPSTFPLSVRNGIHNSIMMWVNIHDEKEILALLAERKKFRRAWVKTYRDMRKRDAATKIAEGKPEGPNPISAPPPP